MLITANRISFAKLREFRCEIVVIIPNVGWDYDTSSLLTWELSRIDIRAVARPHTTAFTTHPIATTHGHSCAVEQLRNVSSRILITWFCRRPSPPGRRDGGVRPRTNTPVVTRARLRRTNNLCERRNVITQHEVQVIESVSVRVAR